MTLEPIVPEVVNYFQKVKVDIIEKLDNLFCKVKRSLVIIFNLYWSLFSNA